MGTVHCKQQQSPAGILMMLWIPSCTNWTPRTMEPSSTVRRRQANYTTPQMGGTEGGSL